MLEEVWRAEEDLDVHIRSEEYRNLWPQNLVSVEIGKDFMLSHGYIKNDFDVKKWAAPKFLEKAAKELLEEQWKKKTGAKLPEASDLLATTQRIG
jgi:hypothetical protein